MYFRTFNVLLVLFGLLLSSPTIKASFCAAKSLKQIYRERVNFEKKVDKPFESFYKFKSKRSGIKAFEFNAPIEQPGLADLNAKAFHFIILEDAKLLRLHRSFYLQRGPPVI
jgi:hypothetical protein